MLPSWLASKVDVKRGQLLRCRFFHPSHQVQHAKKSVNLRHHRLVRLNFHPDALFRASFVGPHLLSAATRYDCGCLLVLFVLS